MQIDGKTFLVLAPHTDDGEFGCGGTISRIIREGGKVIYWAFSTAEESLPGGYTKDDIMGELARSMYIMQTTLYRVSYYPVRQFPNHRQEILEEMVKFKGENSVDTILAPSRHDTHQDHGVIFCEAFRAFKDRNILSYEMPYNSVGFEEQVFMELEPDDIEKKILAIGQYESQAHRATALPEFIKAQARFRGGQVKTSFAEVFEIVRWKI